MVDVKSHFAGTSPTGSENFLGASLGIAVADTRKGFSEQDQQRLELMTAFVANTDKAARMGEYIGKISGTRNVVGSVARIALQN